MSARRQELVEFEDSIAEAIDSDDSPAIHCVGEARCGVQYEIDELVGIDADEELLNAQRDVWSTLFENPTFRDGSLELSAPVISLGGMTSVEPVLIVRCDRRAANQIDWEAVQSDGFKQLCSWQMLVDAG